MALFPERQSPGRKVAIVESRFVGAVIVKIGSYLCKEGIKKNRGGEG